MEGAEERAAVLGLIADVAGSEHRLRHQGAFDLLVSHLGFAVEYRPSGPAVTDPLAPPPAEPVP